MHVDVERGLSPHAGKGVKSARRKRWREVSERAWISQGDAPRARSARRRRGDFRGPSRYSRP